VVFRLVEEQTQSAVQALESLGFGSHTKQQQDSIKQIRLNYWFTANNELRVINERRVAGSTANDRFFRAAILAVYHSVRVSLHRFEKKESVTELNKLQLDFYTLHPEKFTLDKAVEAYAVLGVVLDDLSVF
jgi:hypothetical protein